MTNRQKQNLLQYLGYYLSVPDGIWGEKSKAATKAFQAGWGLPASGVFDGQTEEKIRQVIGEGREPEPPGWWREIPHFRREEFRCPCGACGGFPAEPEEALVRLAEQVRGAFDAPALVSSGVRCPAHNAAVGGVKNSRHLLGRPWTSGCKMCPGSGFCPLSGRCPSATPTGSTTASSTWT